MSATGSEPMISAVRSRPSARETRISSASVMTWSLVSTSPSSLTITPEPKPALRRAAPGGSIICSHSERGRICSVRITLMLTTAGATRLVARTMAVARS